MKIKIISCKDPRVWYNKHINEEFEVSRVDYDWVEGANYFWVRTGDEYNTLNWVHQDDIESVWNLEKED